MGQIEVDDPQIDGDWIRESATNCNFFDRSAPSILLWHQFDLKQFILGSKYIGYTIFELDDFNEVEKHNIANVDELWVCSEWAKNVILNKTRQTNVKVIPLGIDPEIYQPIQQKKNGPYRFFYHGKWEIRKCADIIPELFSKAFSETDDVELIAMTHNPFLPESESAEWIRFWKESPLGNKIKFLPWVNSQREVYNILSEMNAYIGISRAEGFNLPLLNAISCGLPAISTNYSAHTEFCTKDNCYLVEAEELEPARDFKWFHGQGNWMKITKNNEDEIVEYMRYCYKERPDNPKGLELRNQFNWKNSSSKILTSIF